MPNSPSSESNLNVLAIRTILIRHCLRCCCKIRVGTVVIIILALFLLDFCALQTLRKRPGGNDYCLDLSQPCREGIITSDAGNHCYCFEQALGHPQYIIWKPHPPSVINRDIHSDSFQITYAPLMKAVKHLVWRKCLQYSVQPSVAWTQLVACPPKV